MSRPGSRSLHKLRLRFRSVVRRTRVDAQLDAELAFHLEQQILENLAAGMKPEEAEFAARRVIGGIAQIKDQCRDTRRTGWITDAAADVRFALHTFARAPVFAATIVGTLALGIGANTAVFSIADALILRTLPLPQPARLVQILQPDGPGLEQYGERFSLDDYHRMRDAAGPFAQLAAETGAGQTSMLAGVAEETVRRDSVSGNYFGALGITTAIGRTILPEDVVKGGRGGVAVISYAFWKNRFNLDPQVIGRSIRIGKASCEIVGVARAGFFGLEAETLTDIWTPEVRQGPPVRIIGRLQPGASESQLLAPLQALFHQRMLTMIAHPPPGTPESLIDRLKKLTLQVAPADKGFSALRAEYLHPLRIVFAIVGLVLLIACLNVASLLTARATARQREMAVRISLGAGRWRLLRQLLTESLVLCAPAAGLGVALAHWTAPLLVRLLATRETPVQLALAVDGHLLAFTTAVCVAATLLFGLMPAWRISQVDVQGALKLGAPQSPDGRPRAGKLIVAAQVAFSLVLLIGATLFIRTLRYLDTFDIGFERRDVILATVQFQGPGRVEHLDSVWEEYLRRVSRIPGVEAASLSSGSVFNGEHGVAAIRFPGLPPRPQELAGTLIFQASANFFDTIGTPLLSGRDFQPRDFDASAPPVAIVSDTFARVYFGDAQPIGKRFSNFEDDPPRWITVIGVAKDTRHSTLRSPVRPTVFLPYTWPRAESLLSIVVRTRMPVSTLGPALRTAATSVSPHFAIGQVASQERLIEDSLVRERLLATTSSVFAILALLMAAVGLFGLLNYAVARRTQEIGIRIAIGAAPRNVVGMIVRESLGTLVAGMSVGLVLAASAMQWISSLLFGVGAWDLPSVFASLVVLAFTGLAAAWIPSRRASRTEPMAALRCE